MLIQRQFLPLPQDSIAVSEQPPKPMERGGERERARIARGVWPQQIDQLCLANALGA
jgi:hypothetical protein